MARLAPAAGRGAARRRHARHGRGVATSPPTTARSSPTGRCTGCARCTTSTATPATATWSPSCCRSAERTLRWFEAYLGADGLLHDVSGWVLLDWASVYSSGCSSTLNALWARALEDCAEMADWLGNAGRRRGPTRPPRGRAGRLRRLLGRGPRRVRRPRRRRRAAPARRAARRRGRAGGRPRARRPGRPGGRPAHRPLAGCIRHSWVMDPVTADGRRDRVHVPRHRLPRARLGRRAPDGRGRAVLPLRAARRAGPRRPGRPRRRPVPRLEGVPRRRRDDLAGVLERRHPLPRLVVDPDPRPDRAHPRHHAGRARLRRGAGRARASATSSGPGPRCPRPTARSPSRPTPTAPSRSTARCRSVPAE